MQGAKHVVDNEVDAWIIQSKHAMECKNLKITTH
jgi:hypothetical protein